MSKVFQWILVLVTAVGSPGLVTQSRADEKATAILNDTEHVARETRSLSADVVLTWQSSGKPTKRMIGKVVLMKPNYALLKFEGEYPLRLLVSDGTDLFTFPDKTSYTKTPIDTRGEKIDTPWWGMPFRYFFTQSVNPFGVKADPTAEIRSLGDESTGGQVFHVLSIHGKQPMVYTAKLYINTSNLLQRSLFDFGPEATPSATYGAELTNVKLNVPITAAAFRFTPPADAKLNEGSFTDKMLAIGERAPVFGLLSLEGTKISLGTERRGMRATLVNFWYLQCPACRTEFPEFEKLYQEFHAKGFNIVAIDKGDSAAAVREYARKAGLTFPILLGGDDKKPSVFEEFRITAYPGTYLLDEEWRVVYRAAGMDDIDGLRRELTKMGLK
jgi:peroxiredoxin/outer membrane lipoprotein-sorting protein